MFYSAEVMVENMGAVPVHFHKLLEELEFHSCVNLSSWQQNARELTCWNLLCQKLHILSVVKKKLKAAANSVGRETLRKQLGSGSRKKSASTQTNSAKQASQSRRDNFRNTFHSSCRVVFGANPLWQFLEILEGKSK